MTQNYHRYLNLPFTVSKPISFVDRESSDYIDLGKDIIPRVMIEWLDEHGVHAIVAGAAYTAPNSKIHPHCDTLEPGNHVNINFTWGSKHSKTRWWKLKQGKKYTVEHVSDDSVADGDGLLTAKEEDCELLFEQTIDKPSMINSGILHGTYNPSNESRWTMSVVLGYKEYPKKLLQWDDAFRIFKNYIL